MISLSIIILEFLGMNLFHSLGHEGVSNGVAIVCIIISSIGFYYDIRFSQILNRYMQPLMVSYFFRLCILFFDIYGKKLYTLPNSGADSLRFYEWSVHYAVTGENRMGLFTSVMGTIIRWIGNNILYLQFLVMMFSMIAIIALIGSLNTLGISSGIIISTVMIVGILPNFTILSCVFLRESIVVMFLSLSLLFFLFWYKRKHEVYFILAFACVFLASGFHSGAAGAAVGYILIRFFYNNGSGKIQLRVSNIVIAAAFVFVFTYLYMNYSEILFGKMQGIGSVSDLANTNEAGGSTYAMYVGDSSSLSNMVIYTIPRIVYFLFSPFPWQWRGISDIIAFAFSSMFYIVSVYNAIKVLLMRSEDHSIIILLLFLLFGLVFVFAWGTSNTGTATRHREKLVTIFAALWAVSESRKLSKYPS